MTTNSVMSVFPCFMYNSAVRASTSVPFLDTEVALLSSHLCLEIVKMELTQFLMRSSLFSAVHLDDAIGQPMHGYLLRLQVLAVQLLNGVSYKIVSSCPTTLALHSAGLSPN